MTTEKCTFITSPPYHYSLQKENQRRALVESYFIKAIGKRCNIIQGMNSLNLENFSKRLDHYAKDRMHLTRKGAKAFFKQIEPFLPKKRTQE